LPGRQSDMVDEEQRQIQDHAHHRRRDGRKRRREAQPVVHGLDQGAAGQDKTKEGRNVKKVATMAAADLVSRLHEPARQSQRQQAASKLLTPRVLAVA
jgi:hypothetical protein